MGRRISKMKITTINPTTEEILNEYQSFTPNQISESLKKSANCFQSWRKTSFGYRAELMFKASDLLISRKDELAKLMTLEMGKPLAQGEAEAEKCAWACRYYAENTESFLSDIPVQTEMSKSYVSFQPLGPVLAIMPWNFPFWQVFRFAVPALMAGNTGVLKHSRNTMGCAIEIEKIFLDAGFPLGAFVNLVIGSELVAKVIESSEIKAVTMTGSTPAGQEVASKAGSILKKTVMELGGSDPYIILADADLELAAETCVNARLINSGQSCIAAKRFIVNEKILNDFEELFCDKMSKRIMGDPLDRNVSVGPQARKDLQVDLQRQVDESIKKEAKLLLGGEIPDTAGFFYPPSVLTNVSKGMPAYDEELFGPVAAIIPVKNDKEAIRIANNTEFGLGAAIFTSDIEKGEYLAREEIQAGSCFVNEFVKSDPRLPFGGINRSGYGRELSDWGIREFLNIKTVCIK